MLINVTVRASARKRTIEEQSDGSLKIWTNVAPEKGKANKDVVDLLSEYMDIPKSRILLVKGETSNKKIFKIMAQ
jgi:uncharacterized protein YggU (UPF0235/DUF167 family)